MRWKREAIEDRLIAAFRTLPQALLFGCRSRLCRVDGEVTSATRALGWLEFIADRDDRAFLGAWVRCQAEHDSFAAVCIAMVWSQILAEAGRRRAVTAIMAALAQTRGGPNGIAFAGRKTGT